ncbi:dihydrodipicolinate synthase family protein, partial [Roseomonas oryzicola]|nr:dihydrodipicolinate synthase family protein [Neoroseomonas oryzicola]
KLCEQIMGRGSALTRPPRLPLPDADRREVETLMATALAKRPSLPALAA